MNIKNINKQVKGGLISIKAFPGAKLTQLNHYVLPTLEEYSYIAAIIHVGNTDPNDLSALQENVIKVRKIYQNHNTGETLCVKKLNLNLLKIHR